VTETSEAPLLLMVEDDPLVCFALEAQLIDGGFKVVTAQSGRAALKELERDAARFCAIVTDIRLGSEPDGWELGRLARQLQETIPVVYITGDSAREWSANGVPNSIMLQKPFANAQLITAVSTLLNKARGLQG
jgi:DNA-binding response OmpR family regulator